MKTSLILRALIAVAALAFALPAAARAAPDGYTVVLNTIPLVTNKSLFDKLTWEPIRDFAPIGMVATGTFILQVPHRGGGPALLDTTRSSLLPEVPTLREAGVKDFQFTQWLALLAPAGTPQPVVSRPSAALRGALNGQDLRGKFQQQGFEPFQSMPEEAGRFLAAEVERYSKLIKAKGITAN